jgi:hypothetical protein
MVVKNQDKDKIARKAHESAMMQAALAFLPIGMPAEQGRSSC